MVERCVTLPNAPRVKRPPRRGPVSHAPSIPPSAPRTALVVDDYPAVLAWAARAFARLGWRILTATDGPEAQALFDDAANRGQPVDVLVIDLQLPAGGGVTLVRRLRERNPTLPVIALFMGSA